MVIEIIADDLAKQRMQGIISHGIEIIILLEYSGFSTRYIKDMGYMHIKGDNIARIVTNNLRSNSHVTWISYYILSEMLNEFTF